MFHKHQYRVISISNIDIYADAGDHIPIRRETEFILVCIKCGKVKKRNYKFHLDPAEGDAFIAAKGWIPTNGLSRF